MKKRKFKNYLKLGIFLLGISLFLSNCEKEESLIGNEVQKETKVKRISLSDFNSKVSHNNNYEKLEKYFYSNINAQSKTDLDADSNIIILTNEIVSIERDDSTFYTFKVLTETENNEFYNLVVQVNSQQEIIKSDFFKYTPSSAWLSDKTQPYTGFVKLIKNDFVSVNDLFSKEAEVEQCVVDYTAEWECSLGGNHSPSENCGAESFEYVVTYQLEPCHLELDAGDSNSGGGDSFVNDGFPVDNDPTGNGGGSPTTVMGVDIDILGIRLGFNFFTERQKYLWLQGHPEDASAIDEFLDEHNDSEEAIEFANEALEEIIEGGEADYEEKIILDSTLVNHPRLKCVYDKFKSGTNTVSSYLENFLGEQPVAHLKFSADSNFKANQESTYWTAGAVTVEPNNYLIQIIFNTDSSLNSSTENFPTIILALEFIHEMIHAEIYRKLLSYAQEPNIPWTDYFIRSIRNDFGGLSDYYTRYWLDLPPGQTPNQMQHQMMAEHYRGIMIDALKEFDNNQHPDDFYEALSWMGLKGNGPVDPTTQLPLNATEAWKNLTQIDREIINFDIATIINNETHDCNE